MAEIWQVQLTAPDRKLVVRLAGRRRRLGLAAEYTETIRAALRLYATADDDTLTRGTLETAPPPRTQSKGTQK